MLALDYKFVLPAWMVFIVRAVITLDGFALKGSSGNGSSSNNQENAASVEAAEAAAAVVALASSSSSSSSSQEKLVDEDSNGNPSSGGGKTKMEASTNAVEAAYPHAARRVSVLIYSE